MRLNPPALLLLGSLLLPACGLELGFPTNDGPPMEEKKIFLSASTTTGNIGAGGGVEAADALCQRDSNKPRNESDYKALLVDASNRIGKTDEQKDWPLKSKTRYVRSDGTHIGTTNEDAVFTFPLKAAISDTAAFVWVGLGTGWATGNHCNSWKDGTNVVSNLGKAAEKTEAAFFGATGTCDTAFKIYCVEQ